MAMVAIEHLYSCKPQMELVSCQRWEPGTIGRRVRGDDQEPVRPVAKGEPGPGHRFFFSYCSVFLPGGSFGDGNFC